MRIKNSSLLQRLEKAGFNSKEALVYVSLLELGGAYPSGIAEYCGLKRSTVYNILATLSIRGLTNEIKKRNKLFYQIERPEKVLKYTEGRIRIAEEESERMRSLLPDMESLFGSLGNHPKVTYFENKEGIIQILGDMTLGQSKYEMLSFSNTKELEKVFPEKIFHDFRRDKERIGITTRGIVPDTPEDRQYNNKFFNGYKKEVIPQVKYIPENLFPFRGEITIYGKNKVSILNLNKEHLVGTIIEDTAIHGMMRMIFELAWNSTTLKN